MSYVQKIVKAREFSVAGALVLLVAIMSLASPYFFNTENLFNVLRNMSTVAIVSVGVTMVIITGGIDLSVGSMLAVSSMLTARMMWEGLPPGVAFLCGIVFGILTIVFGGLFLSGRVNKSDEIHITE